MNSIQFIKEHWVVMIDFVILIVLFLTNIVAPPYIDDTISISGINIINLTKFCVFAVLVFVGLLVAYRKQRKHVGMYLGISITALLISGISLWLYLMNYNHFTAYNSFKTKRYVIGAEYIPEAKQAIEQLKKQEPNHLITPKTMLEGYGDPEDLWYPEDIENHAKTLVFSYLTMITAGAAFIIIALQTIKLLAN